MSTIRPDVADLDLSDAEDAFSALWGDAPNNEPSEPTEDEEDKEQGKPAKDEPQTDDEADADAETSEETPEGDEDAEGDDETEGEDEKADEPTIEIKDDHKFKFTADGEEREVTLADLKRLYGQEASLTRKSQEVANERKTLSERGSVVLAQHAALLDRAKKAYEPYAKLDLLAASKDPNISAEELVAVRNAAQQAYENVQYLEGATAQIAEALRNQARQDLMQQAQESLKTLSDPEKGIEGFDKTMYEDICSFAVEQGLPAEIVNDLVNPAAIKLINMARLYAKGQKVVTTAKSDKKKAPKRIVKSTAAAETTKTVTKTAKKAQPLQRLQKSGSVDDAADAFMAGWQTDED